MNRKEIKKNARERIKGNIWNLLLPFIIVFAISMLVNILFGPKLNFDFNDMNSIQNVSTGSSLAYSICEIAMFPLTFGCIVYVLKFVRGEKVEVKLLFEQYKRFWPIFCMYFLVGLFVGLWSILLIIPGIIASYKYSMAPYILADGEEDALESIRKSKAMMKGYKWDLFVFQLSFIGWYFLIGITLGIAAIYVLPYTTVAQTMYYEELKKVTK